MSTRSPGTCPRSPGSSAAHLALMVLAGPALLTLVACQSRGVDVEEVLESGFFPEETDQSWHQGPPVHLAPTGPARYVEPLLAAFDADKAMETTAYLDQWYRAPVNDGYLASLEHVRARLEAAGYGGEDERFELREIVTEMDGPSWTPLSASLVLHEEGAEPVELHGFTESTDSDRTILPLGTPPCDLTGPVCLELDRLQEGDVFVTDVDLRQIYSRAYRRGAAAVVSSYLQPFNVDPTGADRHLDAVRYLGLPVPSEIPVAQISPRSYAAIAAAVARDPGARLAYRADIKLEHRPMRTLVAAVRGADRDHEAVASAAHIQEPGAGDNASGVGGLTEGAVSLAKALRAGLIDWPDRTLVFIFGDEFEQTEVWVEDTERIPVAGVSSDMVGNSPAKTGARALLERMPDPGARHVLPPDEHTPWGAGEVTHDMIVPSGLAVIARCAMIDVGLATGPWQSADHPWEGGSDHDVFIDRGIPAVLLWHFTDFSYHTSLDRMDMVDALELERTEVVILATMLAVASPLAQDLDRYVRSVELERAVRTQAAAGKPHIVESWEGWCRGVVGWLRAECLRIPLDEAIPPRRSHLGSEDAPEAPGGEG